MMKVEPDEYWRTHDLSLKQAGWYLPISSDQVRYCSACGFGCKVSVITILAGLAGVSDAMDNWVAMTAWVIVEHWESASSWPDGR